MEMNDILEGNIMTEATTATEVTQQTETGSHATFRDCVKNGVSKYFANLDGSVVNNLYEIVLAELEVPLLEAVMKFTKGNQSKAAIVLGLSRGTLRKKLKIYGFIE